MYLNTRSLWSADIILGMQLTDERISIICIPIDTPPPSAGNPRKTGEVTRLTKHI